MTLVEDSGIVAERFTFALNSHIGVARANNDVLFEDSVLEPLKSACTPFL